MKNDFGISNFLLLKTTILTIFGLGTFSMPMLPITNSLKVIHPLTSKNNHQNGLQFITLEKLKSFYSQGLKLVTSGQFSNAKIQFKLFLSNYPFLSIESNDNLATDNEIQKLFLKVSNYNLAMSIITSPRKNNGNEEDSLLINCRFAQIKEMDLSHQLLALKSACTSSYKGKNYQTAYQLAKQIIEKNPPEPFLSNVKREKENPEP